MPKLALQIEPPPTHDEALPDKTELLFRPEALAEHQTTWMGTVLLKPKFSSALFVCAGTISGIAVLALVFFGSFTRKAHISGWLVPEQGLARIFAPQTGVVTRLHAREGM